MGGKLAGHTWASLRDDHLVRVCVHNQVRVVSYHDDQALPLRLKKQAHQLIEDWFGIEIFLRLVDNKRAVIRIVERQTRETTVVEIFRAAMKAARFHISATPLAFCTSQHHVAAMKLVPRSSWSVRS